MITHAADSHDLIRVHGAREQPRGCHRRAAETPVDRVHRRFRPGQELVFGTIASESQRLINETYNAFVQGLMPALARPEVDVLEGLRRARGHVHHLPRTLTGEHLAAYVGG